MMQGVMFLLMGIILGSVVNLCIDRLPTEDKVYTPNWKCPHCEHKIGLLEQLPILSYLFLGGKCKACGQRISIRYPIVELVNGLAYFVLYIRFGVSIDTVLYCLCASALLTLGVIDWCTYEIPVAINIFIFILGLIKAIMDYKHLSCYVIGFFAVSTFLLLLYYITKGAGIGGGDVKLMAATGLLLGWKYSLVSLVVGCLLGSVIHLTIMAIKKGGHMLAFGPYLSMGVFIAMIWGEQLVSWYLSLLNVNSAY